MNKTEKARRIVQALYYMDTLPDPHDNRVRIRSRQSLEVVNDQYDRALKVLEQKEIKRQRNTLSKLF